MKRILSLVAFLFALTGCTHYYYIPATQNVPLFKEKNEFRANANLGGGEEISGLDLQAAYAITDKFAIMTNFMNASGSLAINGKVVDSGNGNYFDAAFGYFKPLHKRGVFEIYGGAGYSNQTHRYYPGTSDLSFAKIYIQPSIGLTYNGFDIGLTSGLSTISFTKINNNINRPSQDFFDVDAISKNRTSILFEPSLTIRGGWKYVKLQFQFIVIKNLSDPTLKFEKEKFSMGLSFAFAQRFKKS